MSTQVKEPERLVSLVMKEKKIDYVDEIATKLDVSRGFIIRRFTDEGLEKYYSNNKQVVGSRLDPLTIG